MALVDAAYDKEFIAVFSCKAARQQLMRLLGNPTKPARAALAWRRQATKRGQKLEMLQGFTDRGISAARLEGPDIFAACKRAMLFSEEPAAAVPPEVERWMAHIVEAVESGQFKDSVQAWRWFADRELLSDGGARWILELAHSLGNLNDAVPLIVEYPAVRAQVEAYAASLAKDPNLGQYSDGATEGSRRLRDRDVKQLMRRVAAS